MTREKEILNEVYYQNHLADIDAESFIRGAEWADNHPKSPWISVEDDLPCNHPELIDCDITEEILMTDGKFATSGIMSNLDNNGWKFTMRDTKYWMPIPKFPKE